MPDLAIIVAAVQPQGSGALLQFESYTSTGFAVGGTLEINFADNASQQHAAIEAAAKALQTYVNGVVFGGNDRTQIWGGRSV
jgi:hypothetical protein